LLYCTGKSLWHSIISVSYFLRKSCHLSTLNVMLAVVVLQVFLFKSRHFVSIPSLLSSIHMHT
jgi:hypothetical protein